MGAGVTESRRTRTRYGRTVVVSYGISHIDKWKSARTVFEIPTNVVKVSCKVWKTGK